MANLISKAVKRLHGRLCENAGVEIVYARGTETRELTAVALLAEVESDAVSDQLFSSRRRDFGIAADQLIVGGAKIEPQDGDTILANGKKYRVVAFENGRCFRSMDNLGILSRVFTIQTGEAVDTAAPSE